MPCWEGSAASASRAKRDWMQASALSASMPASRVSGAQPTSTSRLPGRVRHDRAAGRGADSDSVVGRHSRASSAARRSTSSSPSGASSDTSKVSRPSEGRPASTTLRVRASMRSRPGDSGRARRRVARQVARGEPSEDTSVTAPLAAARTPSVTEEEPSSEETKRAHGRSAVRPRSRAS